MSTPRSRPGETGDKDPSTMPIDELIRQLKAASTMLQTSVLRPELANAVTIGLSRAVAEAPDGLNPDEIGRLRRLLANSPTVPLALPVYSPQLTTAIDHLDDAAYRIPAAEIATVEAQIESEISVDNADLRRRLGVLVERSRSSVGMSEVFVIATAPDTSPEGLAMARMTALLARVRTEPPFEFTSSDELMGCYADLQLLGDKLPLADKKALISGPINRTLSSHGDWFREPTPVIAVPTEAVGAPTLDERIASINALVGTVGWEKDLDTVRRVYELSLPPDPTMRRQIRAAGPIFVFRDAMQMYTEFVATAADFQREYGRIGGATAERDNALRELRSILARRKYGFEFAAIMHSVLADEMPLGTAQSQLAMACTSIGTSAVTSMMRIGTAATLSLEQCDEIHHTNRILEWTGHPLIESFTGGSPETEWIQNVLLRYDAALLAVNAIVAAYRSHTDDDLATFTAEVATHRTQFANTEEITYALSRIADPEPSVAERGDILAALGVSMVPTPPLDADSMDVPDLRLSRLVPPLDGSSVDVADLDELAPPPPIMARRRVNSIGRTIRTGVLLLLGLGAAGYGGYAYLTSGSTNPNTEDKQKGPQQLAPEPNLPADMTTPAPATSPVTTPITTPKTTPGVVTPPAAVPSVVPMTPAEELNAKWKDLKAPELVDGNKKVKFVFPCTVDEFKKGQVIVYFGKRGGAPAQLTPDKFVIVDKAGSIECTYTLPADQSAPGTKLASRVQAETADKSAHIDSDWVKFDVPTK